jgi:multidrug efflux pump subunit AcrA (membrane-fusion protein)
MLVPSSVRASVLAATLVLAGCATTATAPSNLVGARSAYDQVSMGGSSYLAPDEVRAAREELEAAEALFQREGDTAASRAKADSARQMADRAASAIHSREGAGAQRPQ